MSEPLTTTATAALEAPAVHTAAVQKARGIDLIQASPITLGELARALKGELAVAIPGIRIVEDRAPARTGR